MTSVGATRSLFASVTAPGSVWIIDLDGVIWLSGEPIGDVADAVGRLRRADLTTAFATNNSAPTTQDLLDRLDRVGILAAPEDLASSAAAAASLLQPGDTALVLAEGGVLEALANRGVEVRSQGPVDAVVVGWTREFTFDRLAHAASAVRGGARLIATNDDPTHPTPDGVLPGSGALLAAVVTASGTDAQVAGKPYQPMIDLIRAHHRDVAVVVGDRPSTDGLLAEALGAPFALVLTGVTATGDPIDPAAQFIAADLGDLVRGAIDRDGPS
jgi:4-nitrophenyl phosphatase